AHATAKKRHPGNSRAGGKDGRVTRRRWGGCNGFWRKTHHSGKPPSGPAKPRIKRVEGPGQTRGGKSKAEAIGIRENSAKKSPEQTVRERPSKCPFDMASRPIDKMHVVDARRAGRHAGKAGQTAVDMFHGQRIGGPVFFEHVLDKIDASARRIEFVAKQHEGRAGRRAKAAMDAGAENFFRLRCCWIFELLAGKMRLHP